MTIVAKRFDICSPKFGEDYTFRLHLVATVTDGYVVLILFVAIANP